MVKLLSKGDEDHEQIAKIAVMEAYTTYKERPETTFSGWVYRTISWRLQEARAAEMQASVLANHEREKTPEEWLMELEPILNVRDSLGKLPPRQAVIVNMVFQGHSYSQIAPVLGITPPRVCQEVRDAVQALAGLLEEPSIE